MNIKKSLKAKKIVRFVQTNKKKVWKINCNILIELERMHDIYIFYIHKYNTIFFLFFPMEHSVLNSSIKLL